MADNQTQTAIDLLAHDLAELRSKRERLATRVERDRQRLSDLDAEIEALDRVLERRKSGDTSSKNGRSREETATGFVRDFVDRYEGRLNATDVYNAARKAGHNFTRNAIVTAMARLTERSQRLSQIQAGRGRRQAEYLVAPIPMGGLPGGGVSGPLKGGELPRLD